tara:strand:+ start:182 stop:820 length:639 start_codon:yes stop_codon:yes gene_type:complete
MKKLILAFIIGSFLTSCLEIEKRNLVINQKKKTATFHLKNITSDKEGEDANEDFKNFMTGFETGEILNEFFGVESNLKEKIVKKKIYQRKGEVHAKIVFRYDSLEQMGFNTCFYDDSIVQNIHVNENLKNSDYLHIQQEVATYHTFFTNGMILNAFGQLFEGEIDIDAFPKEEIATKSLAFSWEKGECINYTHFTHIDESNTSIRDYWIANK